MYNFVRSILILSFVVLQCNTLTCRSDGGPKDEELKAIYMACLKKQGEKNTSDTRVFQDDQDRKELRGRFNQKPQWNRDLRDRDDGMDDRDGRMGNRRDRTGGRDDRMNTRDDRRMDSRMDNRRDDRMGGRERMIGDSTRMDPQNYHITGKDGFEGEQFIGRYDYPQNENYDSGMSQYHGYHSTTQSSRRFKRSKTNSGQRSQYNPILKKPSDDEETYHNYNRNSTNSSNDMNMKTCALHCFMEQLKMTDNNGMPDRYLVTHVITKDVKNEDLRDFLQESIEECFQILENENTEDRCQFSSNLLMCLAEKGRANCEDWNDDLRF